MHNHAGDDLVVFLICERCGAVGEAPGGAAAEALKASCARGGLFAKKPSDRNRRHLLALPQRDDDQSELNSNRSARSSDVPSARRASRSR